MVPLRDQIPNKFTGLHTALVQHMAGLLFRSWQNNLKIPLDDLKKEREQLENGNR